MNSFWNTLGLGRPHTFLHASFGCLAIVCPVGSEGTVGDAFFQRSGVVGKCKFLAFCVSAKK